MNLMDGSHVMLPMIKMEKLRVTGRGCSKRNRICVDMNPSMMFPMYGFPISRGCKMRSKISVKDRDCEHKIVGGFFERRCFCRRMLCNLGYDPRQDIMRGEVRGQ